MNLSRPETAIFTASIKAEALSVASEHCMYLANNRVSPEDALHMIGLRGRGWGRSVAAYAERWKAMQRRNVLGRA